MTLVERHFAEEEADVPAAMLASQLNGYIVSNGQLKHLSLSLFMLMLRTYHRLRFPYYQQRLARIHPPRLTLLRT